MIQWAVDNCGYVQADPFADAPEPPDCETLDAAAAADAAGIDVDVTDLDGSADVSLPGFWTKSCSYGNGAMTISTLSFTALEDGRSFYADNLDVAGGVVLDVDVGSLPESSLVIQTGGAPESGSSVPRQREPAAAPPPSVQVAVFEAPIPFSVSFTGEDVDPAVSWSPRVGVVRRPTAAQRTPTVSRDDDRLDLADAALGKLSSPCCAPCCSDVHALPRAEHQEPVQRRTEPTARVVSADVRVEYTPHLDGDPDPGEVVLGVDSVRGRPDTRQGSPSRHHRPSR